MFRLSDMPDLPVPMSLTLHWRAAWPAGHITVAAGALAAMAGFPFLAAAGGMLGLLIISNAGVCSGGLIAASTNASRASGGRL